FISFLLMFALQALCRFAVLLWELGPETVFGAEFPWNVAAAGTLLSWLALEVLVCGRAVPSLYVGKVVAFLAGAAVALVLQVSAAVFAAGWGEQSLWKKVYAFLPPLGEVFKDITGSLWEPPFTPHLGLWAIWLAIFVFLFRVRLSRA